MPTAAQVTTGQGPEPLTESNVNSEVDKILKDINVNDFLRGTTPAKPPLSNNTTSAPEIPAATSIFASFIASSTSALLTPALREKLHEVILDHIAVAAAGSTIAPSTEPIVNGLLAFAGLPATGHSHSSTTNGHSNINSNSNGTTRTGCTAITRGQIYPPQYAALLNGAFAHSLDFDDTHVQSTLHAGATAIPAAFACAEALSLNSTDKSQTISADDILLAIALAYEVTIRIGIGLSTASYARGFHNTGIAGIFGAIAAISSLRHLPATTIANAFGLAGSKAAGSMQYLANGSWNKRLHPGFAAHDAFLCVALAEAGVLGAAHILEGDLGVFQAYTERSRTDIDWTRLTSDLGTRWEWTASALKPYAGCRMTHGFVELADVLGKEIRAGKVFKGKKVRKVVCYMPRPNMILIGQRAPNKVHPRNMVDAQFSAYFQVANALCYGGTHDMAAYGRLEDPLVAAMAARVECRVDDKMDGFSARIEAMLVGDESGGVAGEQEKDEEVTVTRELLEPLGEVSHPFVREKVHEKFLGLMVPVYGERTSRKVLDCVYTIGTEIGNGRDVGVVLELLDLLATP